MRPDSPGPAMFGSIVLVPTMPPSAKATTTKASQPKVAFFQWAALQRPIRAARLEWCGLAGSCSLSFSFLTAGPTLRAGCPPSSEQGWESGSDSKTISAPTQVGGRPRWTGSNANRSRRC